MPLTRDYVLERQFEAVSSGMDLRRPQRDSLRVVHELVSHLPASVADLSSSEIARRAREMRPEWQFDSDYPALTFALATGVGKTRLMGAIAAYLYRAGESSNFVFLAPRDAILRKFENEVREGSDKYLFVDRGIVSQPRVCHRGNLLDFRPRSAVGELFEVGPDVFIFSPHLLVTKERIAQPSEFVGTSILEHLQGLDDLVVFADESHHLTKREHEEGIRTWGGAVTELQPKVLFEMTATPREGASVAHEYGLAQCLRERLYTKAVRMIVDDRGTVLEDPDYDRYTLDAALAQLEAKERAIERTREEKAPGFPDINPVLLVSAADISHADRVGEWLREERGFDEREVLVIHHERKTEEDMAAIKAIEEPESPVRVVVQVHVFEEGWDVTNVYVIAPLRNVRSYVNARQVMGRGLRLPMGRRVGESEVDTLDVLAYGQETFQDVYEQAAEEFGDPDAPEGGVSVVKAEDEEEGDGKPGAVEPEEEGGPDKKVVAVSLSRQMPLELPVLDMVPPEPELDVDPDADAATSTGRTALDLGTMETSTITSDINLPRSRFFQVAIDEVFRELTYLSDPLHRDEVRSRVWEVLHRTGRGDADPVDLDPVLCAKVVSEAISDRYRQNPPRYVPLGETEGREIGPAQVNVPVSFRSPVDRRLVDRSGWSRSDHHRIPVDGWNKCLHEAAHFDSRPEFDAAMRLDRMSGVEAWLRNDPAQVRLPTLAGNTGPDFVVWLDDTSPGTILFLEVKGEHLWEPRSSDSWIRARDVDLWVRRANDSIGEPRFEAIVILGGDVARVDTVADLRRHDALQPNELPSEG